MGTIDSETLRQLHLLLDRPFPKAKGALMADIDENDVVTLRTPNGHPVMQMHRHEYDDLKGWVGVPSLPT